MIVVAACTAFVSACTEGVDNEALEEHADYFVPADATDIVVAPDIPWVQKSFNVSRAPSEFAVSADKLNRATSDGWRLCQPSSPEWASHYDATLTPPRHTKQRTYVLYKNGVLVVLAGTHYDTNENTAAAAQKMTQHGMVIVRQGTDREAQETADSFKLSCE